MTDAMKFEFLLRLGDNALVLAQRLSEWVGKGPVIEEDIALTNVGLDLIGQARMWLSYAGEIEGRGRDEDALAFRRDAHEFRNALLCEQPNGDYAETMARQFLFDHWHALALAALEDSRDERVAAIAAKASKEVAYHVERSTDWVIRLGDGTDESHRRVQAAVDYLLSFTAEFWAASALDAQAAQAGVDVPALRADWDRAVDAALQEATLARPPAVDGWVPQGKQGVHSEHLSYLLGEMQSLARAHPGATW